MRWNNVVLVGGGVAIGIAIGIAAFAAVGEDEAAPAAATTTTEPPPPFDFEGASIVVDEACEVVVDVHDRAARAASEAHERGTYVSVPSPGDMVADAEAIRLRRAALASQVAVREDPTNWPAVDAITLLAVTAQYSPDEVIVGEVLTAEHITPGTSIGVDDAFQLALGACADR